MNHDSSALDLLVEEQEQCKARVETAKMIAEIASLHDELQTLGKEREALHTRITELEQAKTFLEMENKAQARLLNTVLEENKTLKREIGKQSAHNEP